MDQQRAAQLSRAKDKLRIYRARAAAAQPHAALRHRDDAPAASTAPRSSSSLPSAAPPQSTSSSSQLSTTRAAPAAAAPRAIPARVPGAARVHDTSARATAASVTAERRSSFVAAAAGTPEVGASQRRVSNRHGARVETLPAGNTRVPQDTESVGVSLPPRRASNAENLLTSEASRADGAANQTARSLASADRPQAPSSAGHNNHGVPVSGASSARETTLSRPTSVSPSLVVPAPSGSGSHAVPPVTSASVNEESKAHAVRETATKRSGTMRAVAVDTVSHLSHGEVASKGLPATEPKVRATGGRTYNSNVSGRNLRPLSAPSLPEANFVQDDGGRTLVSAEAVIGTRRAVSPVDSPSPLPQQPSAARQNFSGGGAANVSARDVPSADTTSADRGHERMDASAPQHRVSSAVVRSTAALPARSTVQGTHVEHVIDGLSNRERVITDLRSTNEEVADIYRRTSGPPNGLSARSELGKERVVKLERRIEEMTNKVAFLERSLEERLRIEKESRVLYEKTENDARAALHEVHELRSSLRIKEGMIKQLLERNAQQLHEAFKISRNRKFKALSSPPSVANGTGRPRSGAADVVSPGTARRKSEEFTTSGVLPPGEDGEPLSLERSGTAAQKSPASSLDPAMGGSERHDSAAKEVEELRRSLAAAEEVGRELNRKLAHELHINELLAHENSQISDYVVLYHAERRALIKQTQKAIQRAKRGDFSEPFPPPNSMISPTTPPALLQFRRPPRSPSEPVSNGSSPASPGGGQPPDRAPESPPSAGRGESQAAPADSSQLSSCGASPATGEDDVGPVDDPVLSQWLDRRGSIAGGVTVRMEVKRFAPCRECRSREVVV